MAELTHTEIKQRVQAQRAQGDLEGAMSTLQQGIHDNGLELADLYGILGGTRREQGDLVGAAEAYDGGFEIDTRFETPSSYNAINRVITRVLLAPESLTDPDVLRGQERLVFVDVRGELAKLENELQRNIGESRSNDYWAAADLATVAALNGHLKEAIDAVDRFASCSPPAAAYETFKRSLFALAQLDTPRKKTLESVLEHLELTRG